MAGRGSREPMERVVRLLAVLSHAGASGVPGEKLIAVAGFSDGDPGSQLNRDFAHLRTQGWQIDNIAPPGEPALYRLTAGDNRLRLRLSPPQLTALQRAALLADRDDLVAALGLPPEARPVGVLPVATLSSGTAIGHGDDFDAVVDAVRERRTLTFRYKGSERRVHPASLRHQGGQWYLTAEEEGRIKHYVVARMAGVRSGAPGTAHRVEPERLALHPLHWEVDPPVEVTLRVPVAFVPDVELQLLVPQRRADDSRGETATLTYTVTHRAALRQRLYMLGPRVEVVGPEDLREELLAELREMAGVL